MQHLFIQIHDPDAPKRRGNWVRIQRFLTGNFSGVLLLHVDNISFCSGVCRSCETIQLTVAAPCGHLLDVLAHYIVLLLTPLAPPPNKMAFRADS